MSLIKTITMAIIADAGDSQARLDELAAKADMLRDPVKMGVIADTAEAQEQWDALSASEKDAAVNAKLAGDSQEETAGKTDAAGLSAEGAGKKLSLLALGAGAAAVGAVYLGIKFQEMGTLLVTGAGESQKNLAMVQKGILALSGATATSTTQLESGMFMVESAGFHGAAGLKVLQASAEGAQVGNADLGTVADATTTILKDYGKGAGSAGGAVGGLIAIVSAGKTHMTDLATSLSKVLPTAAALKIPFGDVGGALATMTSEGTSARLASTHLNSTLVALAAPSTTAAAAMKAVGLSSAQVASTLTHQGIVAALQMVTTAAGKQFPVGSAGYIAAVKNMTGGLPGLQTALQLTGGHLGTVEADTKKVGQAMQGGGTLAHAFADRQKDVSFELDSAKDSLIATGTAVGGVLLPAITKVLKPVDEFAEGIAKSKTEVDILVGVLVGALAAYALVKVVSGFKAVGGAVKDVSGGISTLIGKLAGQTVATEAQTAATEEATVAQTEFDAAADANPIGLIVLGIAALVAVIILVVTHFKDFKRYATDAWNAVWGAGEAAWNWIAGHWPLILAILTGPIGLAVLYIKDHWNQIVQGAQTAVTDVASWFARLPGMVLSWVASFGHLLWNAGASLLTGLVGGIESEVGHVVGEVEHVGSEIKSGIEHFLGISSPSTVMHQVGVFTVQGLAAGITDSADLATAATRRLGDATLAGYTGGSTRAGYAGAVTSGTGQQVVIQVTPGGSGLDQLFMTWLKQNIRIRGGNPDVLGL